MLKERYASSRARVSRADLFAPYMAGAILVVISILLSAPNAAAQSTTVEFNIPAQPISSALRAYAHQAKVQLLVLSEGLNTLQANAVVGRLDPQTALQMLLAGTGLQAEYRPDATVAVRWGSDTAGPLTSTSGDTRVGQASWLAQVRKEAGEGVMMAQAAADRNQTSRRTETDRRRDENKRPLEEIIVTGTNIRGIAPESSPARTFTQEDVQISGAATAQEFVQTLTSNFGGGSNSHIPAGLPNDSGVGFNSQVGSFGSSVNLHGLGSGSTLVLLNGHRLAPSSGIGDFVDISMIPASALERVDVLSDGASSIYGADAVAGVVNFVLRDDYDGIAISYRHGSAEGDVNENRASITGGTAWATGNALFTYEFYNQTNLSAADRSFSQDAPLPNDLLPSQRRHSALTSISQMLMPNLALFGDFLFSHREAAQHQTGADASASFRTPEARHLSATGGGTWDTFGDWIIDISGTYSRLEQNVPQRGAINRVINVNADLWAADVKVSGTVFSMPGGDVKLAVGGHHREEEFDRRITPASNPPLDSKRDVKSVFGEAFIPIIGADNSVPGIERFEINVSGRASKFSDFGTTADPKVGLVWAPFSGIKLRATYGTSFKPPPLGRVDVPDLAAQSYPSALINSILGLTAPDPIADVVILTMGGTDKNLDAEKSTAFTAGLDFAGNWSRHNLRAAVTFFDIDFKDRLGETPIPEGRLSFEVPNIAFVSPDAFPPGTVIFFPSADQIQEALESADTVRGLFGTDPLDAEVITFAGIVRNLSVSVVRGLDFNLADTYETGIGDFFFGFDGTFLINFQQQATATTPLIEHLDTRFNPVGLTLRGRAGYSQNGLSANLFVNYMDDYRVDNTPDAEPIESWTTVDFSLAYDTQNDFGNPLLSNTAFRLSVRNLFDENPPQAPSIPSLSIYGFDPTNASPLNRLIAVELTKRF